MQILKGQQERGEFGEKVSAMAIGCSMPSETGETHGPALLEGAVGLTPLSPICTRVNQKHFPPLEWEEVCCLHNDWATNQTDVAAVSFSAVELRYNQEWTSVLPFRRSKGQHAGSECVEFKQWRKRTPADSCE